MPTKQELEDAVRDILGIPGMGGVLQLNRNQREGAFEVYVFALVVKAIRQAGGSVELHGARTGLAPSVIVFRGSPGHLGSSTQDFCFARCRLHDKEFEVHLGVQYSGFSTATHEIDVSVIDRVAADAARRIPGGIPNCRRLRAAFECKCYDSHLGTGIGRAFMGLVLDCGKTKAAGLVTNGIDQGLAKYFSAKGRPDVFFRISPVTGDDADRFVANVEQCFRKWAAVI